MSAPYHRFVFDNEQRRFIGDFEAMYQAEDEESFDSWGQEDLSQLRCRLALALLGSREWASMLDYGCGKGTLTAVLPAARKLGIDISPTCVRKAQERHPGVEFRVLDGPLEQCVDGKRFELAVCTEVLSYLEDWPDLLARLGAMADWLFVSLWLPAEPIGYVKSFDDLRAAFSGVCTPVVDLFASSHRLLVLLGQPNLRP